MGQSYAAEGISSPPHLSSSLVCWVPEETFSVFCYKSVRSQLPLTNKACRVWQLFLPVEKIPGPTTVETPQFLGFVVLQHSLGVVSVEDCVQPSSEIVCVVLLILVISASPLIFHQFWQVFLVMLFWLCSSEVFCSVSVANAILAYWNISAGLQLPQLFCSCHAVSWYTHCQVQTLFVPAVTQAHALTQGSSENTGTIKSASRVRLCNHLSVLSDIFTLPISVPAVNWLPQNPHNASKTHIPT